MTSARHTRPESRPDVARIRGVYDVVLYAVLALMFIVGPLYVLFSVYSQKLF